MKRTILVLGLGLIGGGLAYGGWFAAHQPPVTDDPFAWLKNDLQLTPAQVDRIRQLHEQSSPQRLALASQVTALRGEFDAFEIERHTTGEIDFVAFAHFTEQRREINEECAESNRRLITAATGVMTPPQREHYLTTLGAALQTPDPDLIN